MEGLIFINEQGSLILPKELRAKYGLDKGGQVVIEEHAGGWWSSLPDDQAEFGLKASQTSLDSVGDNAEDDVYAQLF
jgi:bifunctional DNA-binding transcriptional regulator/antitoxin component of YhaV-PrlF toxin-antitoxin module